MPIVKYAYFKDIPGSCQTEGREDSVEILELRHVVEVPVDPKNAAAVGTRQHGAMEIVANIDKATPQLMQCVCKSGTVKSVNIEFYKITPEGQQEKYYTITMTDVRVVKAETWSPNVGDRSKADYFDMMTYSLRYNAITWEFHDGNISCSDEWAKPNG